MNRKIFVWGLVLSALAAGCKKKEEPKTSAELHIAGAIQIDPKLAKQAQASDTIFLIARPAPGGPPLAVKKFTGNAYPISFELTSGDLMMQQEALDVPLNLTVRVDKDGDAMSKNPGDLVGSYEKNPVSLQASGVDIVVNEVLK